MTRHTMLALCAGAALASLASDVAFAAGATAKSSSLEASEILSATGATAPRVSLDDLNAAIASENYFTAGEAAEALGQPTSGPLDLLTLCLLTTKSGFTIVGKSAPASPENFDPLKGRSFAREDAIRQLWPLMGFALRERLAAA